MGSPTAIEEYRAEIDAWWRRPLGRGGYEFWLRWYEECARRLADQRREVAS